MDRHILYAPVAVLALMTGALLWQDAPDPVRSPQTVRVGATLMAYRPAGEYRQGTRVVDAPLQPVQADALTIMVYQVSEQEYARCVAEAACAAAPASGDAGLPQTNVSHADATAYALWLSRRTGQHWRLPTDAEWLQAAAERGADDALSPDASGADPSRRWIASYRRDVALRGGADTVAHPAGHYGTNSAGVADMAGNVWEWTETCFRNGTVTADGTGIASQADYCGVRAAQGKHRAFVIDFIRDARSGGCAAGVPPDYLGFRLVRDASG